MQKLHQAFLAVYDQKKIFFMKKSDVKHVKKFSYFSKVSWMEILKFGIGTMVIYFRGDWFEIDRYFEYGTIIIIFYLTFFYKENKFICFS